MSLDSLAPLLDRWFLSESIPIELCIGYQHEKWLVGLSYLVAAFASFTAFHLIGRVRSAPNSSIRAVWLSIAGMSMGCGIFAMHFIAMLAVRIPVEIHYDVVATALSALFAIVASGIAFHFAASDDRSFVRLALGAAILGSGIGLMHYTGMSALQMPAHIYYDPGLFSLSVVVAVALSAVALYALRSSGEWRRLSPWQAKVAGALVMGLAVTLMHYTGMLATYFVMDPTQLSSGATFGGTLMAMAIGTMTFMIGGIAIGVALLDHRAEVADARRKRSESFLQSIIDHSADGILTFDENEIVETCNPAAARIFRRATAEIVGKPLGALIDGGLSAAMNGLDGVRRGEAQTAEYGVAIEYTVSDMRFAGRRMFNCIVRDVTGRKRAEASLRASEERFRGLVANVPGVVYQRQIEPGGRIAFSFVSDQLRDLLGIDPAKVMEDSWVLFNAIHPDDRQATFRGLDLAAERGEPYEGSLRVVSISGEKKWVRIVSRPRQLAGGETIWDGLLLDMTQSVKQAEENKLLESKLRQAQKLEALGTLAGGIAHEFNNMLVPIWGLTEIALRDVPEGTRAHRNLRTVLVNAQRASQLVEKILSFARQEDSERGEIDLVGIVAESVDLLNATTPATISIKSKLDPTVGKVIADEMQMHQVLMNLASNARHAMEGKVGELRIELTTAELANGLAGRDTKLAPGSYAKLSVSDTGHGMGEATMERIFEPFFTTKNVGKGTGLGLAVIHGIIAAHGGAIEVTSAPGVGTTFDIYLPLAEQAAPALAASA